MTAVTIQNHDKFTRNLRVLFSISMALAILATPFIYSAEWQELLSARPISMSIGLTDIYIKASKEFFIVLLFLVSLLIPRRRSISVALVAPLILGVLWLLISALITAKSPLFFISGMRWAFPFFMFVSLVGICGLREIKLLRNSVCLIFIFSFLVQLLQIKSNNATFGLTAAGFSERSAGIFTAPINAGLLAITVSLLLWISPSRFKILNYGLAMIAIFSVILTKSGTAMIGIATIILLQIAEFIRLRPSLAIAVSSMAGGALLFYLPILTARETILSTSGFTRLEILRQSVRVSHWFYGDFGLYTNSAILFSTSFSQGRLGVVADSMLSSAIGNIGLFPALILNSFPFFLLLFAGFHLNYQAMGTAIIISIFSMSLNLSESYPANLIMTLIVAHQAPKLFLRLKI